MFPSSLISLVHTYITIYVHTVPRTCHLFFQLFWCRIALIPEQVPAPDSVEEKGGKKKGGAAVVESPPPVDDNVDISEAVSACTTEASLHAHWLHQA